MFVSYSSYSDFKECPSRFYRKWIMDEGKGDDSHHYAIFGTVTQKLMELFYKERWYLDGSSVLQRMVDAVPEVLDLCLRDIYVNWEAPFFNDTPETIIQGVQDILPGILQSVKDYKLLAPQTDVEIFVKGKLTNEDEVGGRIDFRYASADEVWIVDGKAGRKKGRFNSSDQLLFYALATFLSEQIVPKKLVFWWYRFAERNEAGVWDTGKMWDEIFWTAADLRDLRDRLIQMTNAVKREEFDATPTPSACRYCRYAQVAGSCIPYSAMQVKRKAARTKPDDKIDFGPKGVLKL